jgi:hypothetical protein
LRREESPFPAGWWSSSREPLWPLRSTYDLVSFDVLPSLPEDRFDGTFDWLLETTTSGGGLDYNPGELDSEGVDALPALESSARALGLQIPETFTRFVSDPGLYQRAPTPCGGFLGFSPNLIEDPSGRGGRMLRFLNDSQGCLFWYLYLSPTGESCVLGSTEWHYAHHVRERQVLDPDNYFWSGADFESFLFRYWIEGQISHHSFHRQPLPPELNAYVNAAQLALGKVTA